MEETLRGGVQEYANDACNFAMYEVNTICNYDPAIIPYLSAPCNSAFGRVSGTDRFGPEELVKNDD